MQGFDPGKLGDLTFGVEVLDPAPEVLEHVEHVFQVDEVGGEPLVVGHLVDEEGDVGEVNQVWNRQLLLLQQGARGSDTTQVTYNRWPALLKHITEEICNFILKH